MHDQRYGTEVWKWLIRYLIQYELRTLFRRCLNALGGVGLASVPGRYLAKPEKGSTFVTLRDCAWITVLGNDSLA
jgi:hypothetical protein